MQSSVTIQLSAGRSIQFYAKGGHVRTVVQGYILPREMADAKRVAMQKLADERGDVIQDGSKTWTPRADPSRPAGCRYNTRLYPVPGGRCTKGKN